MIPGGQRGGRVPLAVGAGPHPGSPPAVAGNYGWPALASVCLIVAANFLAVTGYRLPFLGPGIGFWFLLVHPVYLLYTTSVWRGAPGGRTAGLQPHGGTAPADGCRARYQHLPSPARGSTSPRPDSHCSPWGRTHRVAISPSTTTPGEARVAG